MKSLLRGRVDRRLSWTSQPAALARDFSELSSIVISSPSLTRRVAKESFTVWRRWLQTLLLKALHSFDSSIAKSNRIVALVSDCLVVSDHDNGQTVLLIQFM